MSDSKIRVFIKANYLFSYLAYLNRDGEVIDEMHYTSPNDMGGTGASICHNLDYKNLDWPIPLKGFELAMGNPLR